MNSGIYLITNNITGKQYVGQSTGIKRRFNHHKRAVRTQDPKSAFRLHRSMAKHGVENFKFEVLLYASDSDYLNLMEQKVIQSFNTMSPNGYNLNSGGGVNRFISDETRAKIKGRPAWNKGIPVTEERKQKQSLAMMGKPAPNKGKPQSEEQKAKHSATMKGRPAWNKGVPMSEEQKDKLRVADRSYTKHPEYRAKMSEALKKRKISPEHRAKINAALAARAKLKE